ncbi:MAG: hypothetical protein C5B51_31655 [Terriglobia bacterium]|nr:MAG: hypothetical protein C5B51_31655 [Terriglobia bacterium]
MKRFDRAYPNKAHRLGSEVSDLEEEKMTLPIRLLFAVPVLAALPGVTSAQPAPACSGVALTTKAVALAAPVTRNPVVDFSGSGGQLDPTPLLQTDIDVGGRATCIVVHFSVQADPQDNFVVFQASVDDIPMAGHGTLLSYPTPVVADPEETDLNNTRMLAYTFFAAGAPGKHTIRIRIASCCSINPGGLYFRGASLVVTY